METILGRQVPERYTRILNERGVFRELHRSDLPVFISPIPDGQDAFSMPRVAIAVRAGDEVLGSIWAAVPGPLSDERADAFGDAAKLVALHMLRVRAGADVQRRLRADLLSSALEGGTGARDALDPAVRGAGLAVRRRRRAVGRRCLRHRRLSGDTSPQLWVLHRNRGY